MKRLLASIFLGLLLISLFGKAQDDIGGNAFTLMETGFGAYGPAIGGCGTAWSGDASNMWYNPAGLEGLRRGEVMLGYRLWLASIHDEFIGFAWPTKRVTFGAAAFYSLTGVQTWGDDNTPQGKVYPQSMVIDFAFAYSFNRSLSAGLGGKFLYENLIEVTGKGAVFDAGLRWQPAKWIAVGAVLRNIGAEINYGQINTRVPFGGSVGLNLQVLPSTSLSLSVGGTNDAGFDARTGVEVRPHEIISIRAGTRFNSTSSYWGFWAVPSVGLGLYWKEYRIDYAFVPYGPLGVTNSLAVSRYLNERPPTSGLMVKVVDSRDSSMIFAQVRMSGAINDTCETLGMIRRDWLEPGELKLKAEAEGYIPAEKQLYLKPYETNVVILPLDYIPGGILKGIVAEQGTRNPVSATIYIKGETVDTARSDPEWGTYQSGPLKPGEYVIRVNPDVENLIPSVYRVDIPPLDTTTMDLFVSHHRRADVMMTIHLNFETGKAELLPAHAPILDSIAPALESNADLGLRIEIAGHTDDVPVVYSPFGDNQRLSEARAEAIRSYLVEKHGLSEKMFVCKGYGDTQPLSSNESPEGRAMNRRIEFRLIEVDKDEKK
ncbi:PorV/PorQ family protein [candidate division WOR-3 bacterium]|uniref:PorV/PorQ family protein n=1 Tax=candidate division WOR-3 bacterium TaxID=2052148 RepID=A0A9D5QC57_UNCW3|nr:PorV/PorQ family protein [candidate division WOR-3 bacterium]MBD3363671.1 PorV/PorQ family protein [candidate division WOR-3 bacterium]